MAKGKLNGIGGKIEDGEVAGAAMIREFQEETGASVKDWEGYGEYHWRNGVISLYKSFLTVTLYSPTEEKVKWYKVSDLNDLPVISNLKWLIPMALDKDNVYAHIIDPS